MIDKDVLHHMEVPAEGLASETFRIQLYVPVALRPYLVNEKHSEMHMAVDKVVVKLRLQFWLVGLGLFNDDTCPSGHISRPTQVNVSQELLSFSKKLSYTGKCVSEFIL